MSVTQLLKGEYVVYILSCNNFSSAREQTLWEKQQKRLRESRACLFCIIIYTPAYEWGGGQ